MRIAHLLSAPRREGGAEAHALGLAAAQAARGDEVALLHLEPGPDAPASVAARPLASGAEAARVLAETGAELVHVHGLPLDPAAERTLAASGVPAVRSLHDWSFGCASGQRWFRDGSHCARVHGPACVEGILVRGCSHRLDVRPALRRLREVSALLPPLRAAAAVVVYSEAVAASARATGLARVHVVPYFVERPAEPAPHPGGRDLAFVGRVVGAKGLDVALRALALAPDAWDELHVAGDGWARPSAERLADRLGLGDRVRFHGWLAPDETAALLATASALLLPSRWPEPFGIAGLEALALGRPVVASRGGGVPDWLDESCGLLVAPSDPAALAAAVTRLAAEPGLAARLGRAGWERAASFSPARHLELLDAVYASAVAASREAA
ncbi:MAG TPA: glycosyltransferase family 4 protein [Gaiellaceae bacterium]|nr:glycosyltransferase family 4 protein [Gaiellaceae bacterium]